jgi:hypothetical protein
MEAICFSETSVDNQQTTWLYIPEGSTYHNHHCENLKSYNFSMYLQWSKKKYKLGGCSDGICLWEGFMEYVVEMASRGMMCVPIFMKISTAAQALLQEYERHCFAYGRDLWDGLRSYDMQRLIKIGSGIQKLVGRGDYTYSQTSRWSHKPTFIFENKSRPKYFQETKFKSRRDTFWATTVMKNSFKQIIYFKKCMSMFVVCSILAVTLWLFCLNRWQLRFWLTGKWWESNGFQSFKENCVISKNQSFLLGL